MLIIIILGLYIFMSTSLYLKLLIIRNKTSSPQDFEFITVEPWHEISNNVVCATSKGSDQPEPVHMGSLIRTFARRIKVISY